jgi:hypothetical protein
MLLLAAVSTPAAVTNIIVVFKTHYDIGYTDLAGNMVQYYRSGMMDAALSVVDGTQTSPPGQRFIWTIPGWPMKKILEDWPGQTASRKQRVSAAFAQGRFVTHALPFNLETESLELEDLVRGLGFSSQISRSYGLPLPRDAKMTDVPEHTWIIPTLLKHAGVNFLHIGCNPFSSSPDVPALFWWEGPDGSRLLTMYTAANYGTQLTPPSDWPASTWLDIEVRNDNLGPPSLSDVTSHMAQASQMSGVTARIGRMSDFADAVLAENPTLPVVRGDMPDTWIHGFMSNPDGIQLARKVRTAMMSAEALRTQLRGWGVRVPEATSAIAGFGQAFRLQLSHGSNVLDDSVIPAAYEQSLLYGEHTWGLAAAPPSGVYGNQFLQARAQGSYARAETSWADKTAYIHAATNLVTPFLQTHMQLLAASVATTGPRIVVYNPLPWTRDGWVAMDSSLAGVSALTPTDASLVVAVETNGASLGFLARGVPPMGYRTFVPTNASPPASDLAADAGARTIENAFLKATLDPSHGVIQSLVDKSSGRELATVIPGIPGRDLGQYLYERFDANQVNAYVQSYPKPPGSGASAFGKAGMPPASQVPYTAVSPTNFVLQLQQSPVSLTAVMDAATNTALSHAVTTKVILYAGQPYLDLEVTVHAKALDPWPEAGWICLPLNVVSPQFRLGRLGSIVDPATDIISSANHDLLWLNGGLTVTDASGTGAGLCPLDHPMVALGRPGCWLYSRTYTPTNPAVYINLFNNQWNTNFRFWNGGTWTSRVRLWAVGPYAAEPSLVTPAWESRFPLLAACSNGGSGGLPSTQSGLQVSRKGVLVTAFGPNPDGAGTVLRLWEHAGQSGDCTVTLPQGMNVATVQPVNLRGETDGAPLVVQNRQFTISLGAFAPASVLIRPSGPQ